MELKGYELLQDKYFNYLVNSQNNLSVTTRIFQMFTQQHRDRGRARVLPPGGEAAADWSGRLLPGLQSDLACVSSAGQEDHCLLPDDLQTSLLLQACGKVAV